MLNLNKRETTALQRRRFIIVHGATVKRVHGNSKQTSATSYCAAYPAPKAAQRALSDAINQALRDIAPNKQS